MSARRFRVAMVRNWMVRRTAQGGPSRSRAGSVGDEFQDGSAGAPTTRSRRDPAWNGRVEFIDRERPGMRLAA
jgi:hypothetical protein